MLGTFLKYRDTHFRVIVLSGGVTLISQQSESDRRGENENIWERLPSLLVRSKMDLLETVQRCHGRLC